MKRKLLSGLILGFSAISVNSVAMEIHGGKLISEKEWTSGNIKGSFKESAKDGDNKLLQRIVKHKKKLASKQKNYEEEFIFARNQMFNQKGPAGVEMTIEGFSGMHMENFTSTQQTYQIFRTFCVENLAEEKESCVHYAGQVQLEPSGYIFMSDTPAISYKFEKEGTYGLQLDTDIRKDKDSVSTQYFSTYDYAEADIGD